MAAISATVRSRSALVGVWPALFVGVLSGIAPSSVGLVGVPIACKAVLTADGAGEDGGDEEVEADSLELCLVDQRDVEVRWDADGDAPRRARRVAWAWARWCWCRWGSRG
jgi:hypothetical protein